MLLHKSFCWQRYGRTVGRKKRDVLYLPSHFSKCTYFSSIANYCFVFLAASPLSDTHTILHNSDHCGTEYLATTEPALLTSPEYPSIYPHNVYSCDTTIHAGAGQAVLLNFEVFRIATYSWAPYCAWDYLEV